MSVRLNHLDRTQAKAAKDLRQNTAQLDAMNVALANVQGKHKSALRQIIKKLEKDSDTRRRRLENATIEVNWNETVSQPLMLHLQGLSQEWSSQGYSSIAIEYLRQVQKFGGLMYAAFNGRGSLEKCVASLDLLIEEAPTQLGPAEEASPFYPKKSERQAAATKQWEVLLREMQSSQNEQYTQEGIEIYSGYLDMFYDLAECCAAALDGEENRIGKALNSPYISQRDVKALDKLYDSISNDDDYKLDKKAMRAFKESSALQQSTPAPRGSLKSRRL